MVQCSPCDHSVQMWKREADESASVQEGTVRMESGRQRDGGLAETQPDLAGFEDREGVTGQGMRAASRS